jgi:hypothetical protein
MKGNFKGYVNIIKLSHKDENNTLIGLMTSKRIFMNLLEPYPFKQGLYRF